MQCPRCHADNPVAARFCANCGAALIQHCSNCQAEMAAGARFCMNCGQPSRLTSAADHGRHARLTSSAPAGLARKAQAAAHLAGERRMVTILFADVVGSSALAEQLSPEAWTAIMNGAFDRITPAIYRYEGTIARLVGDGLWAFFGAPVAHEDDPVRAVQAALDLAEPAREYAGEVRLAHGVEFAMRACVNTGPVVVGPVGDDLRYEYTAMGGAVNLAARLKFSVAPMTVVISENTYRFVAPVFDCEDRGLVDIAGRAEHIRAYLVRGRKPVPGSTRGLAGLESPMVGREPEIATLTQLCDAVRAGLGRAVVVVGEPGLGKTRLIAEWKAAVLASTAHRPPRWVEGRCLSYGQGQAYHLLIELLHSMMGTKDSSDEAETSTALHALTRDLFDSDGEGPKSDVGAEVYAFLARMLLLPLEGEALERVQLLDPRALQTQYLESVRRLFLAMAERRPLVVVLEDLHWADPSSAELLTRLLPLASVSPVLFCLVARPDRDAPGWRLITAARKLLGGSLTEITLTALSDAHSRKLVSNLLHIDALPDGLRTRVLERAEGNPLFVEEVLRMLIDRGVIVRDNGDWVAGEIIDEVDIPDSLQGLLLARIDRLSDEAKHTLRIASVIGRQFPVKVLQQVLEEGREL
jgi:class 3 adenylate cyclase